MSTQAIQRAVEHVGSQTALAERIRTYLGRDTFSQQTISYWIKRNVVIEAEYWPAIEFATGNHITRADLRPDVFGNSQQ